LSAIVEDELFIERSELVRIDDRRWKSLPDGGHSIRNKLPVRFSSKIKPVALFSALVCELTIAEERAAVSDPIRRMFLGNCLPSPQVRVGDFTLK
jgi:hypothetical protein